jgi:pyrimidine operon attenuation protein/uracil phosphoribosyltransferase
MAQESKIMDDMGLDRALARITHEIIERNNGVKDVILLGIKTRGIYIAQRLSKNILKFENVQVPVGVLDITQHRDDLSPEDKKLKKSECEIPCDITDKTVILVDDVLYTGRTIRAAIESVFNFGRPKTVELAVLIDRGHRELPIRPDYVGKNVPTSRDEVIKVMLSEIDDETAVYIMKKTKNE